MSDKRLQRIRDTWARLARELGPPPPGPSPDADMAYVLTRLERAEALLQELADDEDQPTVVFAETASRVLDAWREGQP